MSFQEPHVVDGPPTKLIAQGLQLIKMENDSQQMMALQNPRNEEKLYAAALKELEVDPAFASKAFYSIPYKDKDSGKMIPVEGPGIGAAMALARRWGNCANSGRLVDEREDYLIAQGVFLDYETNFRTLRDVTVQKKFKRKDGGTYTLTVDRLQMAIQAGISKAVRNAILASLPKAVVNGYFNRAKEIAVKGLPGQKQKPVAERLEDAKKKFKTKGVTEDVMKKYIANRIADNDGEWKDEDVLTHLIGIWNAIDDDQARVEDVFGDEMGKAAETETPKERAMPTPSAPQTTPPSDLFKK